jgi:ribonuclease D
LFETELPQPWIVTSSEELKEALGELKVAAQLAVDVESDSFYAYRERVCLIQISSLEKDYILDPLAVSDISALGEIFLNPAIEKIFHAGEYDVICLKRDYDFKFQNLFDTMIAARFLSEKELGLKAAISRHFGINLSKKHQRADWGKRPLSDEQIRYAQMDTRYLISLSDIQKNLLRERGRLEDAKESAEALSQIKIPHRSFDPEGYRRLKGSRDLPLEGRGCLRELYLTREKIAQARNKACFRIMTDELLVKLAAIMPQKADEFSKIKGMTPYLSQVFGTEVLSSIVRGRQAPENTAPEKRNLLRIPEGEKALFEKLRFWRKSCAESEGLDPAAILSMDQIKEIAHAAWAKDSNPFRSLSPLKKSRYEQNLQEFIVSYLNTGNSK